VRNFIRRWMDEDHRRTMLLTTHYLVEAEELCDRVAIINKGRVLACDTPAALKQQVQKESIFEIHLESPRPLESGAFTSIQRVNSVLLHPEDGHTVMEVYLQEESAVAYPGRRLRQTGGGAH
jgi:ABC-2 type transport system ATP-binding protein